MCGEWSTNGKVTRLSHWQNIHFIHSGGRLKGLKTLKKIRGQMLVKRNDGCVSMCSQENMEKEAVLLSILVSSGYILDERVWRFNGRKKAHLKRKAGLRPAETHTGIENVFSKKFSIVLKCELGIANASSLCHKNNRSTPLTTFNILRVHFSILQINIFY